MKYLEQLQALDPGKKDKIMIIASVVAMVVVIYFWLAYFNNLIAGSVPPSAQVADANGAQSAATATEQEDPGVGARFTRSMGFMWGQFEGFAHRLGDILQTPRQYIVHPPQ